MTKKLKKILHSDDDSIIRELVLIALEEIGKFTILQCKDREETLAKAELFHPDLFLIDIKMRGWDGIKILQELRKIPSLVDVPAILMTARAEEIEMEHFKELDILGVIEKPFDPITLAETIRKLWNDEKNSQ
jgi:two-component system, OmpR family, response regulator